MSRHPPQDAIKIATSWLRFSDALGKNMAANKMPKFLFVHNQYIVAALLAACLRYVKFLDVASRMMIH